MAIRRAISTQDAQFDPYGAQIDPAGIVAGEPAPGSYQPNTTETPTPTPPPPPGVPTSYRPMAGWDGGKLNDPAAGTTDKYLFGRFLQDQGYGAAGSRGRLNDIAAAFNQQYGKNVRATGDDSIDFGGSIGNIDVINGTTNDWQWLVPGGGSGSGSGGGGAAANLGGLFDALGTQATRMAGQPPSLSAAPAWTTPETTPDPQRLSRAIEGARMPYEIARRTQLNNAQATLADRGLLSEPGHAQGSEVGALQRIETGLAPAYTGAINDRLQQLDALGLAELTQNRLWNQFLADYGLNRDQVAYDMQRGNTDQYLQLLRLWLESAQTAGNGFI